MGAGLKLFDGDADVDGLSRIAIDEQFAKRYEHNKKREELQRYEELKKSGQIEDSSSEPSSDEEIPDKLGKRGDFEFFDALVKIKNKDLDLKNRDGKLFDSGSEDESDGLNRDDNYAKGEKKPMYLKDVVSKHLIEAGPEFDDDRDSDTVYKVKSYSEEQEEFRRDVLKAIEEGEKGDDGNEEGDFLRMKVGENVEEEEEVDEEVGNKMDEYFGKDEKLDANAKFLKEYFRNSMWLDNGKSDDTVGDEVEYSEDEDELERQEAYERDFNFRFEENAGDRVMGHSRKVEGSVRKKNNSRKLQRDRKEERIAQAELERTEELKHLKNLKKKEINDKLQKIREVAGIEFGEKSVLDEDYLEEEFDPDEYDRKMKEAFNEEYYRAEDVDPEFGTDSDADVDQLQKPDFDKEDELLGLKWDGVMESGEGFVSARRRIMNNNVGVLEESETVDVSKRKRKRKPSETEKAVREQLMEEYYKLDYEDTVGDLKTRFKYKQVNAKRFGLRAEEILMMDDMDLNQYVPLKKLAPYQEEWKVPRMKTIQLKQMNKKLLNGQTSASAHKNKLKKIDSNHQPTDTAISAVEPEQPQAEELNINLSRGSKRRMRQAALKLSHSRLMAYGKIPSKSKNRRQKQAIL